MAQVIKYTEGFNPYKDFVYYGEDALGGVFATGAPHDMTVVNIGKEGVEGDFEVFPTKGDLIAYLSEIGANWFVADENNNPVPFDPAASAQWVWDRLELINAKEA